MVASAKIIRFRPAKLIRLSSEPPETERHLRAKRLEALDREGSPSSAEIESGFERQRKGCVLSSRSNSTGQCTFVPFETETDLQPKSTR